MAVPFIFGGYNGGKKGGTGEVGGVLPPHKKSSEIGGGERGGALRISRGNLLSICMPQEI